MKQSRIPTWKGDAYLKKQLRGRISASKKSGHRVNVLRGVDSDGVPFLCTIVQKEVSTLWSNGTEEITVLYESRPIKKIIATAVKGEKRMMIDCLEAERNVLCKKAKSLGFKCEFQPHIDPDRHAAGYVRAVFYESDYQKRKDEITNAFELREILDMLNLRLLREASAERRRASARHKAGETRKHDADPYTKKTLLYAARHDPKKEMGATDLANLLSVKYFTHKTIIKTRAHPEGETVKKPLKHYSFSAIRRRLKAAGWV